MNGYEWITSFNNPLSMFVYGACFTVHEQVPLEVLDDVDVKKLLWGVVYPQYVIRVFLSNLKLHSPLGFLHPGMAATFDLLDIFRIGKGLLNDDER